MSEQVEPVPAPEAPGEPGEAAEEEAFSAPLIDDGALVLLVRGGPLALTKRVVRPGGSLTVGRTDRADLELAHDRELLGIHFTIAWQEGQFWLIAEKSETGVFLNGREVERAPLTHKAWIHAGQTDFTVSAQLRVFEEDGPMLLGPKQAIFDKLDDLRMLLYAILDASRDPRVLDIVQACDERIASLYDGPTAESLADVAPYLVELPRTSPLLPTLIADGWGEQWGIYVASKRPFLEVRRHFRRFLMVEDAETHEKMYFRFYDPAVFRDFLPTTNQWDRTSLFTDLTRVYVEGAEGELLAYEAQGQVPC